VSSVSIVGKSFKARVRKVGFPHVSKSFKTEEKALAWIKTTEEAMEASKFVDNRAINKKTFGELIDDYLVEVGREREIGETKRFALLAIHRALGSERMEYMTSRRLIDYVKSRRTQGAGGTTINMDLGFIGSVLSHAKFTHSSIDVDMVKEPRAYMKKVRLRTKSKERDRRPTNDELAMLKAHFRNKKRQKIPMWDMIDFATLTAMRLGEVCRIVWADVNYVDQTVIIRDRKDPEEKEGNDQVVPILDDAWAVMLAQPKTDDRIFPYNAGSVSSIFPRATKACGIVNLHFHDLRHEGTSQLFEMGYEIQEVAVFTGHRDWSMLKRYVHLRARELHFDKNGNRRVRKVVAPELVLASAA